MPLGKCSADETTSPLALLRGPHPSLGQAQLLATGNQVGSGTDLSDNHMLFLYFHPP